MPVKPSIRVGVDLMQEWLESEGIEVNVPAPDGAPSDPYIAARKPLNSFKSSSGPTEMDKLRKFLDLDRKVLRFFCVWDDRDQMFGEARKFILHVSSLKCFIKMRSTVASTADAVIRSWMLSPVDTWMGDLRERPNTYKRIQLRAKEFCENLQKNKNCEILETAHQ